MAVSVWSTMMPLGTGVDHDFAKGANNENLIYPTEDRFRSTLGHTKGRFKRSVRQGSFCKPTSGCM